MQIVVEREVMLKKIAEHREKTKQHEEETRLITKEYDNLKTEILNYIKDDFNKYLSEHPEIPIETMSYQVYTSGQAYAPDFDYIRLLIELGEPTWTREEMYETKTKEVPINVSEKFKDFIERNRPIEISVQRYFNKSGWVEFYK